MSLPAILTASAALENANLAALGIKHAFDTPPETLTDLPVAVRFAEGTPQMHGSRMMGRYNLYNFKIEVHWPRGVLWEGIEQCFGTVEAYQDLYAANLNIGATCDVSGFREPAVEGPVYLRYGTPAVETIGFIFYMWAKEILDDLWVDLGGAPPPAPPEMAYLLETGQTTCYAIRDDGDVQAGVDKAYTVNALAGNTDIEVAHYAANTISFTAPNTIADAAGGLAGWAVNDRMVIKGSANNDGEVTVTGIGGAPNNLTITAAVNELAGAMISLYKVAAHSNNVVTDDNTGLMWSRYTTSGERVGPTSNGRLNWYDVATRFSIYAGANTVSVIMPGNILRITGGAALTQFHEGDCIQAAGFANAVNNLPFMYVESATPNGPDLDIVVDPGNQVLIAEGAVGDTIYLNCQSIYNYTAGARTAGQSGFTDWRNPDDFELAALRNMEAPSGSPDAAAFPVWGAWVWSSTTTPDDATEAIECEYGDGTMLDRVKTITYLAALVRLGT